MTHLSQQVSPAQLPRMLEALDTLREIHC